MRDGQVSERLLAWYDRSARVMPWRVGPAARAAGVRPDPYRIWMSEVMLQQTTVAAVVREPLFPIPIRARAAVRILALR